MIGILSPDSDFSAVLDLTSGQASGNVRMLLEHIFGVLQESVLDIFEAILCVDDGGDLRLGKGMIRSEVVGNIEALGYLALVWCAEYL